MATYDPAKSWTEQQDPTKPPTSEGIVGSTMAPPPVPGTSPAPEGIVGRAQTLNQPAAWSVNDDQTVEGRINRIIGTGSPLQVQAKSRAIQDANARGLANTSMAVTAGESALYDAALPIAQADAATAAKAAGYNTDQANQFAVRNVDAQNQFGLQKMNDQRDYELARMNRDTQTILAEKNHDSQMALSRLDAEQRAQATALAAQNQRLLETNSQANSAFNTAMSAVNNIQNNANLDGDAKTRAVAQVWRDLQTQLRVMESVTGLNLTSQLQFANYPGFDSNGAYVGFPDAPPTSPSPEVIRNAVNYLNNDAAAGDGAAPGGGDAGVSADAGDSGGISI